MSNWRAYCNECSEEQEFEQEEGALGWMFGHSLRAEHYDVLKEEL